MPQYLSPGVYVEEFELGARPIEGVATSIAAFLGEAERGSTRPTLVTSWHDYQRRYGGMFGASQFLPYAVKGFFDNGGRQCYLTRIVKIDPANAATPATGTFGSIRVRAVGAGSWGDRIYLRILPGSSATDPNNPETFRIKVFYWRAPGPNPVYDPDHVDGPAPGPPPRHTEDFDDLVMNSSSPDYFEKRIGGFEGGGNSSLIQVELVDPTDLTFPPFTPGGDPPPPVQLASTGGPGSDGAAGLTSADYAGSSDPENRTGLSALNEPDYDNVSILYAPDQERVPDLRGVLITHCENRRYRFVILDSPGAVSDVGALRGIRSQRPSSHAALYYPWIRVVDAQTGERRLVPPGGHAAGVYARTDNERGVWKAPANEILRGAVELQFQTPQNVQDELNPAGVNVTRAFPGRGRRIWGARTLDTNSLWKYVPVRRLFIFLEASIDRGTQWVVFEPNTPQLWARVKQSVTQFLRTQWREGALFGRTEEDAFFVNVDETTMSPDDIANGKLIVVVGVAPVRPAEFVIFRIAQLTGSATEAQAQLQ